jgi:hypothetical protein
MFGMLLPDVWGLTSRVTGGQNSRSMRHLMLSNQVIVESRIIEIFEECDSDGNRPMLNQCRNGSFY